MACYESRRGEIFLGGSMMGCASDRSDSYLVRVVFVVCLMTFVVRIKSVCFDGW